MANWRPSDRDRLVADCAYIFLTRFRGTSFRRSRGIRYLDHPRPVQQGGPNVTGARSSPRKDVARWEAMRSQGGVASLLEHARDVRCLRGANPEVAAISTRSRSVSRRARRSELAPDVRGRTPRRPYRDWRERTFASKGKSVSDTRATQGRPGSIAKSGYPSASRSRRYAKYGVLP